MVGLDEDGHGLLELATALAHRGHKPRFVVVTRSGLGTLNHTRLTVDALRAHDQTVTGLVIGAWPDSSSLAERCNAVDLALIAPVLAALPVGIGEDEAAVASAIRRRFPDSYPLDSGRR